MKDKELINLIENCLKKSYENNENVLMTLGKLRGYFEVYKGVEKEND